jgi:segregation and condensation protein B
MPSKVDDLVLRIEALLFAGGKPMSVKELTDALALSDFRPAQHALRTLQHTYENRQTAMEVRKFGDRYALQLKESYVPTAHSVMAIEMAPRTLKTLTLIAYHQPVLQSVLVRMIGEIAYEEVPKLRADGFIRAEPKGSTLELTTTKHFAEYFGIGSTNPDEIRRYLEQKLGVGPQVAPATEPDADSETAEPPTEPPAAENEAELPAPPAA